MPARRISVRRGELGAVLGLAAGGIVAAVLGQPPPLEPLAALIMEWTPVPIANALLDVLGAAGKPLALLGASAIALAVAILLAGMASARPLRWLGLPVAVVASLILAAPLARSSAIAGVCVMLAAFWLTLLWPLRRARPHADASAETSAAQPGRPMTLTTAGGGPDGSAAARVSRRRLVGGMLANAAALVGVALLPVLASTARAALVGRVPRPRLFGFEPPAPRDPAFTLPGITPEVTPPGAFYRMSKNVADPVPDPASWSLTVSGRVRRAATLTLDDLATLPRVDRYVTMQCVSNPVGGPLWSAALFSGVELGELLRRVEPLPDARWISFEAPDGHREQLPLDRARHPFVLVAYAMNGDWLAPTHGFPARLLASGLYGFRSVKWLERVELLAEPRPGHWEERGWTAAEIHTTARVDLIQRDEHGALAAGVAFAGRRGVRGVEVRVDGGPWQPTTLHLPPLSELMWVQWQAPVELPASGEARVEARAIDGTGAVQDERARGQHPNGATGLHGLTVRL